MPLSREEFVKRWKLASLSERASAQPHFIDLCEMLGEPHPAAADAVGERYTFEKHVTRTSGGKGFADVWMRDHFAWEYKQKDRDLKAAYRQLKDYHEDLGNPPLLVVCDFDRFEIHTTWTSTRTRVYSFNLDDLKRNVVTAACPLPPLDVLRALFGDTDVLRPNRTDAFVTQEAAKTFARLAERLEIENRSDTETPIRSKEEIAHFLMRLLFCLFADNIGLLPNHLFRNLIQSDDRFSPKTFLRKLPALFKAMSELDGVFGEHTIPYFNGGLFDSGEVIPLDLGDLGVLYEASKNYDWSHVAPEIFGTLFERSLNKERRSLIGAHYTSAEDILLLIEPVVMRPLKQRWQTVRESILAILPAKNAATPGTGKNGTLLVSDPRAEALLAGWFDELAAVRVLDPACGSGNFLYLALRRLLDLWNEARVFAVDHDIQIFNTYAIEKMPSPEQLFGIEIEFYAHELASIVVWIGFLQWKREHGIVDNKQPVLRKLTNIEHDDAILRYDGQSNPFEPEWPKADYIVGNPPFVGGNKIRQELGNRDVDALFSLYNARVPPFSDLVCYWFEKARAALQKSLNVRVGLIATQSIRGGVNREVLKRIKETGTIFLAYADQNWILQGATVHVSLIGFSSKRASDKVLLNGVEVPEINANLTTGIDTTKALRLEENAGICFMGVSPKGPFDVSSATANAMLRAPINTNGRRNSDVLRRVVSSIDLGQHPRGMWTIDFGTHMTEKEASHYEVPFEYVREHVLPKRENNNRQSYKERWWLFGEPRPAMRKALSSLERYIATPAVSKHRIFVWLDASILCNQGTLVFARQDDYFFGILQSRAHQNWARQTGTQLREAESGFRYTPNTTFDTFPFPWPPGAEPSEVQSSAVRAIADAARELDQLRNNWLRSTEKLGSESKLVLVVQDEEVETELKKRTLTNLYNKRRGWLEHAHRALDEAVFAAYGWPPDLQTQEILARLLALNHERAAAQPVKVKTAKRSNKVVSEAENTGAPSATST